MACVARRLCTTHVHPDGLRPFLACRLIALNKNPGVRPIGISEVPRRIIAKSVLHFLKQDIMEAAGPLQLCAGQRSGIESAIHAMRTIFNQDDSQGLLLVDASNAFNSLNRSVALLNIRHVCPPIFNILCNCYRSPSDLFVDGSRIYSEEGTTQGDPLAMPMYALATVPLIRHLSASHSVKQAWYADDASSTGLLENLRDWWDDLRNIDPKFGYDSKTWLVVKSKYYVEATELFRGTGIQITSEGRPLLGSPVGSQDYINRFVQSKVDTWSDLLFTLSHFAETYPQAVYSAVTHGVTGWWQFLCRTTPNICPLLSPLEDAIRNKLIPSLVGRDPSINLRELFALPVRLGGLGICDPTTLGDEYNYSTCVSSPLIDLICGQGLDTTYSLDIECEQANLIKEVKQRKEDTMREISLRVHNSLPPDLQTSVNLASEKGASNWLSSLPLQEYGFSLHKSAFWDALSLRYGWTPKYVPTDCVCGKAFTMEHSLSCVRGGFPSLRHNEIRLSYCLKYVVMYALNARFRRTTCSLYNQI